MIMIIIIIFFITLKKTNAQLYKYGITNNRLSHRTATIEVTVRV